MDQSGLPREGPSAKLNLVLTYRGENVIASGAAFCVMRMMDSLLGMFREARFFNAPMAPWLSPLIRSWTSCSLNWIAAYRTNSNPTTSAHPMLRSPPKAPGFYFHASHRRTPSMSMTMPMPSPVDASTRNW